MHALKPTVYRLPIHLEDQQLVYYNPDDNPNEVLERGANKETQLTTWFKILVVVGHCIHCMAVMSLNFYKFRLITKLTAMHCHATTTSKNYPHTD